MKSGLVMNTFVLEAFRRFGAPCPLTGLYTSDEEIASPSSRPVIETEAKDARAVFNAEPGRPSGNLVSRRKGAAFIEFEVTGQAAHSGAAHAQGISAIEALARKVQRLHRLTDYDLGTTVNVGLVEGGTAVNTVAARATAAIDVRFPTLNIMEEILGEVREICRCCELPGSEGRILREGSFLPLEQDEKSRELLDLYSRSAPVSASRYPARRRAAPPTAASLPRSAPRPCVAPVPSAATPIATMNGAASTRSSRAPRRWH
jgi:glutamate carboxypeptidase